jgi:hypothetical protein
MVEFGDHVRNPVSAKDFHQQSRRHLPIYGGVIQATFAQQYRQPTLNAVEQASLIWPEAHWHPYGDTLLWVQQEIGKRHVQLRPAAASSQLATARLRNETAMLS